MPPDVNADEIRKAIQAQGEELEAYEAARLAATRRDAYLDEKRSFVTETFFSHQSKLDLIRNAQAQGFRVVIFHVNVQSADISVARVRFALLRAGTTCPSIKSASDTNATSDLYSDGCSIGRSRPDLRQPKGECASATYSDLQDKSA